MINLNHGGGRQLHSKTFKLGLVLLAAAAASPAQAQTSVTMYGNLDVSIGKENGGAVVMGRGYNNWLGFKGQEDLGDGLAAIFNLQTRFIPGTGAQERPTTFFQAKARSA